MPVLTLNGIHVPVASAGEDPPEEIGSRSRSRAGTLRRSVRAVKRSWSVRTGWLTPEDAAAFRLLLLGEGHLWTFDDEHLFSTKGLGPVSVTGTPTYEAGAPDRSGSLGLSGAVVVSFPPQASADLAHTASLRHYEGGTWRHYVVGGGGGIDPGVWVDGVRNNGAGILGGTVDASAVDFGTDTIRIDDLWLLPFRVPDAWPAQMAAGYPSSHPGGLRAGGDLIGTTLDVLATVEGAEVATIQGELRRALSFRLTEV